jgi:DNA-binding transcriptional regulator YbjK
MVKRGCDGVKKKHNWLKIKAEYQGGQGSMRELCEKYGISQSTMEKRAVREQWTIQKQEISRKVAEKVAEKVSENITELQKIWVLDTIKRGIKARGEVDLAKEQAACPAIDPGMQDQLSRVEQRFDEMVRKALGLEEKHKVELSGNVTLKLVDPYAEPEE